MSTKLTCFVCDRPEVEDDICPNCETDLSMVRMLMELPPQPSPPKPTPLYWPRIVGIGVILLALGVLLGMTSSQFIPVIPVASVDSVPSIETVPQDATPIQVADEPLDISRSDQLSGQMVLPETESKQGCGGFYYTVRSGDTLSQIALNFYGNQTLWNNVGVANPSLQGREHQLMIGDVIFVPNQEETCPAI